MNLIPCINKAYVVCICISIFSFARLQTYGSVRFVFSLRSKEAIEGYKDGMSGDIEQEQIYVQER